MVVGLRRFVDHFEGLEESFILIGGTACDLVMRSKGLDFRATKDLDIVLVIEALRPEFFKRFWTFIRDGRYECHRSNEEQPRFYRFSDPGEEGYPAMIELLCRNYLDIPKGIHLTPIPVGEDTSSLSAILLDDAYYEFTVKSRTRIDGIPTIPAHCLIPLKARAHLDLLERKQAGDAHVRERDVKKHRNDVFRLYRTLAPGDRISLPRPLKEDLIRFLDKYPPDSEQWPDIHKAIQDPDLEKPDRIIMQLSEIFEISS